MSTCCSETLPQIIALGSSQTSTKCQERNQSTTVTLMEVPPTPERESETEGPGCIIAGESSEPEGFTCSAINR